MSDTDKGENQMMPDPAIDFKVAGGSDVAHAADRSSTTARTTNPCR